MAGTWFKQMHGFYRHPKTKKAGEDAADLFVRGIDYCTEFLTDGFIPEEALDELSRKRDVRKHVDALVRVGYWEIGEDEDGTKGWWVHNFLDVHPSKEDVEAKRDKDRRRKSGGKRAESRRTPKGIRAESTRNASGIRTPDADADTQADAVTDPPPGFDDLPFVGASTQTTLIARESVDPVERDEALAELRNGLRVVDDEVAAA